MERLEYLHDAKHERQEQQANTTKANPAGASRLQSLPPVRRVAELGSFV